MFSPGQPERSLGYIYEDERKRIYTENEHMRRALVECRKFLSEMHKSSPGFPMSHHPIGALLETIDNSLTSHKGI